MRRMTIPTLTSERLILRAFLDKDTDGYAQSCEDEEVMRFLGGPMTRTQTDEMLARMRTHWDTRGFGVFAMEHEGMLSGMCGIITPRWESRFQPCVEILWRLRPELWGRGLVTEAARAALKDGFDKQRFEEVLAFTIPANERSTGMPRNLKYAGAFLPTVNMVTWAPWARICVASRSLALNTDVLYAPDSPRSPTIARIATRSGDAGVPSSLRAAAGSPLAAATTVRAIPAR